MSGDGGDRYSDGLLSEDADRAAELEETIARKDKELQDLRDKVERDRKDESRSQRQIYVTLIGLASATVFAITLWGLVVQYLHITRESIETRERIVNLERDMRDLGLRVNKELGL